MVPFHQLDCPTLGKDRGLAGVHQRGQKTLAIGVGLADGGPWPAFVVEQADAEYLGLLVDSVIRLERVGHRADVVFRYPRGAVVGVFRVHGPFAGTAAACWQRDAYAQRQESEDNGSGHVSSRSEHGPFEGRRDPSGWGGCGQGLLTIAPAGITLSLCTFPVRW